MNSVSQTFTETTAIWGWVGVGGGEYTIKMGEGVGMGVGVGGVKDTSLSTIKILLSGSQKLC